MTSTGSEDYVLGRDMHGSVRFVDNNLLVDREQIVY